MDTLAHLTTFAAAARLGSFAAAGRQLGVSPAMVGRRIQAVERHYGVRLIERTTRSLRLTDVGQQFLASAIEILEAVDHLDDVAHTDEIVIAGRVRISGPTSLGSGRLARIIANLSKRWPALSIELLLTDRKVDLIGEGFDLAIRVGELQPSGLIAARIGTYTFACCAEPRLLEQHGFPQTPADLANIPCVLNLNMTPRDRWPFLDEKGRPFSAEVRGPLEIDNDEAQRIACLEGGGVIYVPRHVVEGDLRNGRLVEVLADWRKPEMPINAIHPSRQFVPKRVTAIIDGIRASLAEPGGG